MSIYNYHNYQISYLDLKNKEKKKLYHVELVYTLHKLPTSLLYNVQLFNIKQPKKCLVL